MTRSRHQAEEISAEIRELGGEVIRAAAIRIEPPEDFGPLDRAIERLAEYDWIIFTSANAVRAVLDRSIRLGRDPEALARARVAAIGPSTAAALSAQGVEPEVVPSRFVAEEVFAALRARADLAGRRVLLPRADVAREALPRLLRETGAEVDVVVAYRTVAAPEEIGRAVALIARGEVDVVTFTSGSTVRSFFSAVPAKESIRGRFLPASIGPITSAALRVEGFDPEIEASEYTARGLVRAIAAHYRRTP